MKKKISQVVTALFELEAKGCHTVFFEYGDGLFSVRIYRGRVDIDNTVYEDINMIEDGLELLLDFIERLKNRILNTSFQCYRRRMAKGAGVGEWKKTRGVIEFGEKAVTRMNIDGSGYCIDDPENRAQYFVDFTHCNDPE